MKKKIIKNKLIKEYLIIAVLIIGFIVAFSYYIAHRSLAALSNDAPVWSGNVANSFKKGNGSLSNPYQITNGDDLAYLGYVFENEYTSYANKYFALANDINMNNISFSSISYFDGNFDGKGHTIANINIASKIVENAYYEGLFAKIENANISNLNLENMRFNNSQSTYLGSLSGMASDSTLSNISIIGSNINSTLNTDSFLGGLVGYSNDNSYNNIYVSNNISTTSNHLGSVIGFGSNDSYSHILVNSNNSNSINNTTSSNIYYNSGNNFTNGTVSYSVQDILNMFSNSDYTWLGNVNGLYLTMEENTGANNPYLENITFSVHDTGIEGDTVYLNDLASTYYDFMGQNYTYSSNLTVPTMVSKNINNSNNLVRVQITYHGTDINNAYTGTVSNTEMQSKFVYYKYYKIVNGQIDITLIDNPFSNRPIDRVFNGWITNYPNATVTLDNTYYERHLTIPVSNNNDIVINVYASWIKGSVALLGTGTFTTALNSLESVGLHQITTSEDEYAYIVDGYYTRSQLTTTVTVGPRPTLNVTFNRGTCEDCYVATGNYNNYTLTHYDNYTCPDPNYNANRPNTATNTCNVYYLLDENDTYDENTTYYSFATNNGMTTTNIQPTLIATNYLYDSTDIMAGYFKAITIPRYSSITGYYNSNGVLQNGTCNTTTGCPLYEYLNYDVNNIPYFEGNSNYYYLTTRDTNIIVLNSNSNVNFVNNAKPFTFTALHNGTLYNTTWDVSSSAVVAYANTRIENMIIRTNSGNANTNPATNLTTSATFYGNAKNVKLGRGIKRYNTNKNFIAIVGSTNSSTGSNGNATKYKLEVESGFYNSIAATNGAATGTTSGNFYIEAKAVYGNDYDRAGNNNNNLDVYYCASGTWKGNLHSDNDTDYTIMLTVKSGQFGSSRYDLSTGIYVGGRYGGTIYAPCYILVEGGWIYNLIGGPLISDGIEDKNMIDMHMTGGQVDVITGGAGTTTTYGNRIIAVTGGIVNFAVFGGSNGYTGGNGDGEISADTYLYIGGNALVGNDDYTRAAPFGVEKGSVFGSGNGNTNYDSIGSVNNSYIIIADEATVKTNVYGGGNFGALGYAIEGTLGANNTYTGNTTANIDIIGGVIEGSVFGAGNNNGSGTSYTSSSGSYWNPTTYTHNIISNTYINHYGGLIKGNIYGGANVGGVNFGNVYINSYGGVVTSIYGGGYGGYTNANNPGTYIAQNVNINIGNNSYSTSPLIKGNVYGGGAFGSVNTNVQTNTGTNYQTNVTVNKGTIEGSAFGGGEGNNTYTPIVAGDVTVTINGGSVGRVFGANDAAGSPLKTITVNVNNGTVGSAFAGGNRAGATSPDIYVNGGTVTNVFGGSNETGTVNDSYVEINNGTVSNVYGGNNAGGTTATSYVHINNSATNVYGGNNLGGSNTTSNVYLNDGTVLNAFGGGNRATTTTSNVYMDGVNITNLYGGGNLAEVTTTNVHINDGVSQNTFGGGNQAEVGTSNIIVDGATTTNLYGAGNEAGATDTNVNLLSGTIVNTYGGANQNGTVGESHIVTGDTTSSLQTLTCPSLITTNIYGGNNMGGTTNDTNLDINCGTVSNIYGGGNEAITSGNTNVFITDSTINSSVYGGGNRASVLGNATTSIDGTTTIQGSLFGGGNNGAIGATGNESISTVNLVGGNVYGNVYGGCNTSIVYGVTDTNIGTNASTVSGLKMSDIYVEGTVFGGGEANASGSEDYDYSFISVTVGIDVLIDGTNYLSNGYDFSTHGSIFGSGNASSSSGYSYVTIRNLGTRANPNENISIQRADVVTIDNSVIELTGATDRTNEYSNIKYSFNQIKDLKIKNNSVVLLQQNANRLETFRSLVDINNVEQKAAVTLDENGDVISQNVDNRVYLLANRNLNIATNEAATSYGQVSGMTFMGMYTKYNNNSYSYGLYDPSFSNGDEADAGDIVIGGSYILGLHYTNHDITVDGYYTNTINDEYTEITTAYIDPTPKDTNFYRWIIGSAATNYEFTLTASKYSSLGTYELSLRDFTEGDTLFYVQGFNSEGLTSGITLVDSNSVPKISTSEAEANSIIGLSMKSETTEWANYGTTKFLSANNGTFTGTAVYQTDSQTTAPSLMFYLYHAKNITIDSDLGTVIISLLAYTPTNEIEGETSLITVTVNIVAQNFNDSDAYDASISYGKKYEMPSATSVNITNKSQLTTYFSLISFADSLSDFYGNGNSYHHALTSNIVYPVGTKITMLDYGADAENPNVYYYIVDNTNYATSLAYYNQNHEAAYYLSNFIKMDSVSTNNTYSDSINNQLYYDSNIGLVFEEFIFIIDFENTNISGDLLENTVLIELRNSDDFATVSVLGIRQSLMKYSLYESSNIQLEEVVDYEEEYIYNNTDYAINYEAIVAYDQTANLQSVIDTNYESNSMGLNVYLYDSSDTLVSSSLLEDTTITINNVVYHADANGVFRIKLADKVANLSRTVNLHIGNVLAPDSYTLYFKLFASNDGLYSDGIKETMFDSTSTLLDRENAFSVEISKEETILYREDLDDNQLNVDINYMSVLNKPNIRVALYKRNTTADTDIEYTEVSMTNYFNGTFLNPSYYMYINQTPYEKMVINNPNSLVNAIYTLKNDIPTGTYKLSFILYNQNDEIDRIDKYFIIKTKF